MINQVIKLKENDAMYKKITDGIANATDDDLIIVARSYKNRKDDAVQPIEIKNGIYFYVAYDLPEKLAFLGKITPEQINKAKENTAARAVIGTNFDIIFGNGTPFAEWEYDGQPMNVASLETKMNGAGAVVLRRISQGNQGKDGRFLYSPQCNT